MMYWEEYWVVARWTLPSSVPTWTQATLETLPRKKIVPVAHQEYIILIRFEGERPSIIHKMTEWKDNYLVECLQANGSDHPGLPGQIWFLTVSELPPKVDDQLVGVPEAGLHNGPVDHLHFKDKPLGQDRLSFSPDRHQRQSRSWGNRQDCPWPTSPTGSEMTRLTWWVCPPAIPHPCASRSGQCSCSLGQTSFADKTVILHQPSFLSLSKPVDYRQPHYRRTIQQPTCGGGRGGCPRSSPVIRTLSKRPNLPRPTPDWVSQRNSG